MSVMVQCCGNNSTEFDTGDDPVTMVGGINFHFCSGTQVYSACQSGMQRIEHAQGGLHQSAVHRHCQPEAAVLYPCGGFHCARLTLLVEKSDIQTVLQSWAIAYDYGLLGIRCCRDKEHD